MRGQALTGIASVALLACAAPALAAGERQSGSLKFTATKPGAPTGTVFAFEFTNPDDPNVKPHSVASFVIHYPAAASVDTTLPPQCHASDAELQAEGAAACPPETKLGGGLAVSDTGGGGPFPRYSRTDISQFNNQDELIGVGQNEDIPAIRTVTRTKFSGSTASTEFPPFPGLPPPDPFTPLKSLRVEIPPYVRGKRAYARTPPVCPRSRRWLITVDFTYRDGVTQSVTSASPCTRARRARKHRHHRRHRHRRHQPRFTG